MPQVDYSLTHREVMIYLLLSISNIQIQIRMGSCNSGRPNAPSRFGENQSFLLYSRNPVERRNLFEIHFTYDMNLSTMSSEIQNHEQGNPHHNRYEIRLKKEKSRIQSTLDDIGAQIQAAFEYASRSNFSKVLFVEPFPESHNNLNTLFDQIIRMLFCFDQQGKFATVQKVYLNWSSIDWEKSIANIIKEMTVL